MHTFHQPYGQLPPLTTEKFELTDTAKRLRRYYEDFVPSNQRPPTNLEITRDLGINDKEAWDAMDELYRGVQLMFIPGTESPIKMPPFAFYPTRHRITLADGRAFWAGCAGESCAFSMQFPGQLVTVESSCPCCWEPIVSTWEDGELKSTSSEGILIHVGLHPDEWEKNMLYVCESINFFVNQEHVERWWKEVPEQRGATLPIENGQQWVAGVAKVRYWDYDRPSDGMRGASTTGSTVAGFRDNFGADVTNWL